MKTKEQPWLIIVCPCLKFNVIQTKPFLSKRRILSFNSQIRHISTCFRTDISSNPAFFSLKIWKLFTRVSSYCFCFSSNHNFWTETNASTFIKSTLIASNSKQLEKYQEKQGSGQTAHILSNQHLVGCKILYAQLVF